MGPVKFAPRKKLAPACFLDRDGVLNVDFGHVGDPLKIKYIDGALHGVKLLNDLGFRVFIVTNQAGIGKGLYGVADYQRCMDKMTKDLANIGARYDDIRFCPFHINATSEKYRVANHSWRKPNPGMLIDLMKHWSTCKDNSFLIGDKQSDLAAAKRAGIKGYFFSGKENLYEFITNIPEVKICLL